MHRLPFRALTGLILLSSTALSALPQEPDRGLGPFYAMDTNLRDGVARTPEQTAVLLRELGYDGYGHGGTADLGEWFAALDRHGLKLFSTYVGIDLDGALELDPSLLKAVRSFEGREAMIWLNVQGRGYDRVAHDGDRRAVEAIGTLAEYAQQFGVKIALYPHTGFYVESHDDALRLVEKLDRDNVGVSFNLCHWLKVEGNRPVREFLARARGRLFRVSINGADGGETKSMGWNRLIQPLGSGTYDVSVVLDALRESGYEGPIGLQGYGVPGDSVVNLRRSVEAWKELSAAGHGVAYEATWESLSRYECPEWFRDAKFGIYVHWGVYSVAGRGCWYGRQMYREDRPEYAWHVERFGHPSEFGYRDLIPLWKAESFDPDAWLAMFADAGARYFTPCAVHHDGFDLWDSPHPYNSVELGPGKNLIGMLKEATERQGLRWGVTTHFARNYNFFQTAYGADTTGLERGIPYLEDTPENHDFYHPPHGDLNPKYPVDPSAAWRESWSTRVADLIDRYDPDVLYFDGALPFDVDDGLTGRSILARYYNRGRARHGGVDRVVMTIKTARDGHGIYRDGVATLDLERHRLDELRADPWQTDDTIGVRRWSHEEGMSYRSVDSLIDHFVDIVSKNGNLLLNVPPRADGSFDEETRRILREIGRWNRQNGEAIFGTRPRETTEEGEVRFTRSRDGAKLYALLLSWPEGGRITLASLPVEEGRVVKVVLLGSDQPVDFRQEADGLQLSLPGKTNDYAVAVRIELDLGR